MGGKARVREPMSEELVACIRETIGPRTDIVEKRMFGGIAFLYEGKMTCGVVGRDMCVRVSENDMHEGLRQAHIRPMDFTGRPMRGFLYLGEAAWRVPGIRKEWIERSIAHAASLLAKKTTGPRARIPKA